jgi:hypothetical protein
LDDSGDDFPFKGDNHYWYTKTGRIYLSNGERQTDLVELVSDVEQAPKPDAAPSESLVERVAESHMQCSPEIARAAIREVAAWLREGGDYNADAWADMLEREVFRG